MYVCCYLNKMPDCWAKSCKSRNTQKRKNKEQLKWEDSYGKRISFHRIPAVPEQRKKWLDAMDLCDTTVPQKAFFCSLHFKEKDLDRTSLVCTRLKTGALPSQKNINARDANSYVDCRKILNEKFENVLSETKQDEIVTKEETYIQEDGENSSSFSNKDISAVAEEGLGNSVASTSTQGIDSYRIVSTPHSSRKKDQGVNVSPNLTENTPRKRLLRDVIQNIHQGYKRKIKGLQQKQRRLMKSVAKLKSILEELKKKNLLNTQQLENFKSCDLLLSSSHIEESLCISPMSCVEIITELPCRARIND